MLPQISASLIILACAGQAALEPPEFGAEILRRHASFLASDSLEGRVIGSAANRRAGDYIAAQFAVAGLQPLTGLDGFVHEVPLNRNLPGDIWLEANGTRITAFSDVSFFGFRNIDGPANRPFRFVGAATARELETVQAGDVIITSILPGGSSRVMPIATQTGASAMVYVLPEGMETTITEPEAGPRGIQYNDVIPTFFISEHTARELWADYDAARIGDVRRVTLNIERISGDFEARNIVAMIEGDVFPDEFVVVAAHYDHLGVRGGEIYNGADDNASGTAALLALAESWSARAGAGDAPDRTLVFAAFDAEEFGNLGALGFADAELLDPARISAVINMDGIGRREPGRDDDYIYVVGTGVHSDALPVWVAEVDDALPDISVDNRLDSGRDLANYYSRSDHWALAQQGVPAVMLFAGLNEDYHAPTDNVAALDFDLLAIRTLYADALIAHIANAEIQVPRRDPPPDFVR
jgi:hypothetical protein